MDSIIFGKYINNHSFLTRMDARVKIFIMVILLVFCFLNLGVLGFTSLFVFLCLLMVIAKLSFKSLFNVVKHMWLLFVLLFVINTLTIKGEVLFEIWNGFYIYKEAVIETLYIVFRLIMILMISTLLSSSTTPNDLTYGMEFYLYPLKIFKVNVHEIALMVSIALRFIPTLLEEMQRIMKAQTSRGIDFKYGKYKDKIRGITSLIIPLFISCFDRADELTNAMVVRGYNSEGIRSKYKRLSTSVYDLVGSIFVLICFVLIIIASGVVL